MSISVGKGRLALALTLPSIRPEYDRSPHGRFIPRDLRDEMGRRLVPVDPLEVERRLKARENDRA